MKKKKKSRELFLVAWKKDRACKTSLLVVEHRSKKENRSTSVMGEHKQSVRVRE